MNKQTSKTTIWLRSLLVLPLLALLLVGFSSKETVLIESEEAPKEEVLQEKASQKEVDEYNRLARKYNTMDKSSQRILLKEVERMKYIYNKMSSAQRSAAEPFPELPPPPPPPPLPEDATPAQIKKYKKAKASYDKAKVKAPSPPPPPPPPIPANATPEQVKKYKKAIKEYNKKVKKDGKVSAAYNIDPIEIEVAPVNTKPIDVKTNHKIEVTPVIKTSYSYRTDPSTGATVTQVKPSYSDPGSPLDHIIEMAKRGANFYYEDDKISSDKAIEIIKNKPYLNIQTRKYDSDNPTVHISKKPIVVSPDPDPSMDLTDLIKKGATFYYNDKKISTAKAKKLAKNTDKLARVEVVKDDDGKPEVHFWSKS